MYITSSIHFSFWVLMFFCFLSRPLLQRVLIAFGQQNWSLWAIIIYWGTLKISRCLWSASELVMSEIFAQVCEWCWRGAGSWVEELLFKETLCVSYTSLLLDISAGRSMRVASLLNSNSLSFSILTNKRKEIYSFPLLNRKVQVYTFWIQDSLFRCTNYLVKLL